MPQTPVDRIDGLTTSVAVKAPCHCATTANITLAGLQTIDGFELEDTYPPHRVLVKNQTDPVENGIYNPHDGGQAWTRALDFDGQRDARNGTLAWVNEGDTNVGLWKVVATDDPVEIDTSDIEWEFVIGGDGSIFHITHEKDGGGSTLATGVSGDVYVDWAFEVVGWVIQADQTGSIVFDIWVDGYVLDTPPTVADTITASAKPTLSSGSYKKSTTLTGWTTTFSHAAGNTIRYKIDSVTTITRAILTLICRRL